MVKQFIPQWVIDRKRKSFIIELLLSFIALWIVLSLFSRFVNWVESRQGVIIPDPVLGLFSPVDLTWLIFFLIYAGLILSIAALAFYPEKLLMAVQAYTLMVLFRTAAMYVIPLEAPPAMIALQDPLVEILGTGQVLTRDLFFSGHTATIFLLVLCVPQRNLQAILLGMTFLLAACLLLQHVHYTVDVLAAPFFSYGAYRIVKTAHQKFNTKPDLS